MVIRKTMSNMEIYNIASVLAEVHKQMTEGNFTLPVKAGFYFQKNAGTLIEMAQDLDEERSKIITKFGTQSDENPDQIQIPKEKLDEVNGELNDLFSLEQEVAVNMIDLNWFDGVNMTPQQIGAITFMISDEE